MTIYTSFSEIDTDQWQQLIVESPHSSFFQTPECYNFFSTLSFVKPFVFGVSEENKLVGIISGFLISDGIFLKKYFSRRAIVSGGALLHPEISSKALQSLLETICKELKNKAIYLELRNYSDYSDYRSTFKSAGFEYIPHLNFHVDTPDVETSLKNLNTTKRRDVKLSAKEGAVWHETKNEEDIKQFYAILERLYKTKIKTPLFPLEFFIKLNQLSAGKLLVIKYKDEVIGGSQCVVLKDNKVFEWFVCGLDGKFKNIFPSTVATWAGIEYAASNGYQKFDMMGAGKPNDGYGVRDFKSKFGGELVEHGRFQYTFSHRLYRIGKYGINKIRSGSKRFKKKEKPSLINTNATCKPVFSEIVVESDFKKINQQEWSDFVKNHPNGNIFQTPEMYQIYLETDKFKPIILVVKDINAKIIGSLLAVIQYQYNGILGILTARSIVNGGPLVENGNPKVMDLILNEYNLIVKKQAIFTQFRNSFSLLELNDSFQKNGYVFSSHLNYIVDLKKGQEEIWNKIHDGRKNKIKKALKSGLSVIVLEDNITTEQVIEGYNIIKKVYDKADLPLADMQLIINAVNTNHIVLFLVIYEQKIIGCRFTFKFNCELYGWYAGSYSKYYCHFPNDLLIWETLKWGNENGYKSFDYGGAGSPNKPYGVRNFKAQTGGLLVNYGRYENIHKPVLNYFARLGFKIWQKVSRK